MKCMAELKATAEERAKSLVEAATVDKETKTTAEGEGEDDEDDVAT